MSSFGAMSQFRVGYWRGVRNFILNQRRDVGRRLEMINAEIERIGWIRVQYERKQDPSTGRVEVSENRLSFSVSIGSSLERLIQAYIVQGGNPFDISHFFYPDETEIIEGVQGEAVNSDNFPYGGVVYPKTAKYNDPVGSYNAYTGGFVDVKKYLPNRLGDRRDPNTSTEAVVDLMHTIRKPVNQEIREKIQDIEARITKLCDLREQLVQERDDILVQAHGGTLYTLPEFNTERYASNLRTQTVINTIDKLVFDTDSSGLVRSFYTDREKVAQYDTFFVDEGDEIFLMLMS